jgi:hypothetical protein
LEYNLKITFLINFSSQEEVSSDSENSSDEDQVDHHVSEVVQQSSIWLDQEEMEGKEEELLRRSPHIVFRCEEKCFSIWKRVLQRDGTKALQLDECVEALHELAQKKRWAILMCSGWIEMEKPTMFLFRSL